MHTQLLDRLSSPLLLLTSCALLCCACNTSDPVDDTTQDTSLPSFSFDNALSVSDQRPDPADAVLVDSVTLEEGEAPAFLVIRDSDADGLPSRTIGTLRLDASGSNLTVTLDRDVLPGERLHASLYEATDDAPFDFMTDPPLLGTDGLPVQQTFAIALPEFATLDIEPEHATPGRVYLESIQVQYVEATTANSLLVAFRDTEAISSEQREALAIATLPIQGASARDVTIPLDPLDPDTTRRFPNQVFFEVALFQDNAPIGAFGPEDTLELDAMGEPVIASTIVHLDPQPAASLSCLRTYAACIEEGARVLPLDLSIQADYDGYILARYTDGEDTTQTSLTPIAAGPSSLEELTLPTDIACGSEIELSLLVDLPGFGEEQLLALDPLPIARDVENEAQQCNIALRDPLQIVTDLSIEDDDTISAEIFSQFLIDNRPEALFLAIYTTGQSPTLIGSKRITAPLTQIEVDLVTSVASGDTLLFKLFLDRGEPFVFEPENGVDAELFLDAAQTRPAEQTVTIP